jgi:hypothetical protein
MTDYEIDIHNRLLWWLWTGEWRDKLDTVAQTR